MKNPTQFLIDLVDDLNVMAYCNGLPTNFTTNDFDGRQLTRAFDLVEDDKQNTLNELAQMRANSDEYEPADYNELAQSINHNNKLFTDLCLLQELVGTDYVDYVAPQNLPKSIITVSELLVKQLECKAELNPFYNEYYCKKLTSVLAELIKEV